MIDDDDEYSAHMPPHIPHGELPVGRRRQKVYLELGGTGPIKPAQTKGWWDGDMPNRRMPSGAWVKDLERECDSCQKDEESIVPYLGVQTAYLLIVK